MFSLCINGVVVVKYTFESCTLGSWYKSKHLISVIKHENLQGTLSLSENHNCSSKREQLVQICEPLPFWKGKIGHIDGKNVRPKISDNAYADWGINDITVMSWLLNSMSPKITESFLFLGYVKEIWDSVGEKYRTRENLAWIYQLQQEISRSVKGDKAFHVYFSNLKMM